MSSEVDKLRQENLRLRELLSAAGVPLEAGTDAQSPGPVVPSQDTPSAVKEVKSEADASVPKWNYVRDHCLTNQQVKRYGRQVLVRDFGIEGQAQLAQASVLVVGAGGLGSPAALYLAAAGIGRLGLVDRDVVETSNLHRQVIHSEGWVGVPKVHSAAASCQAINSTIKVDTYPEGLTPGNAVQLVRGYDVVLDCTDNPGSRYVISDACACVRRPLVSGAALGTDGQLSVYCHGPDSPCYRCLFPSPLKAQHCQRCADGGVLGPVPGVIGTLQALEAIKIISKVGTPLVQKLLTWDAMADPGFMAIKLKPRSASCAACGQNPSITCEAIAEYDYLSFIGGAPGLEVDGMSDRAIKRIPVLPEQCRMTAEELSKLGPPQGSPSLIGGAGHSMMHAEHGACARAALPSAGSSLEPTAAKRITPQEPYLLIDVRPKHQYAIGSLPGSINVPMLEFSNHEGRILSLATGLPSPKPDCKREMNANEANTSDTNDEHAVDTTKQTAVVVVCRRGNDSQLAVQRLLNAGVMRVWDIVGGLEAWHTSVDTNFPIY